MPVAARVVRIRTQCTLPLAARGVHVPAVPDVPMSVPRPEWVPNGLLYMLGLFTNLGHPLH